ncbi:MAG: L-histidine N(alpha)-methyltransferase [Candidatus Poribacteria bacterium]|nr:L-histidine N(alpha)-methyltransferase [Candidatus Poribacteria bacterium]
MVQPTDLSVDGRLTIEVSPSAHSASDFAQDVREGLSAHPKRLPPKYFYDEAGSKLFEAISELPEYYVTRTELALLQRFVPEIAKCSDGNMAIVELGSGSSRKTRLLIEALIARQGFLHYFPVDISEAILMQSAKQLLKTYPELEITAHVAEYKAGLHRIAEESFEQKMVLFLGSNIGNFDTDGALDFLAQIRRELNRHDYLLLGTDMQKDVSILEAAYDDSQNVTAAFNLNILRHINRQLGGNFEVKNFSHLAFYNAEQSRIEMHLRSEKAQSVHIGKLDTTFQFGPGETIHTENSYKYSSAQVIEMCAQTGFHLARSWQDERGYFSLNLLSPL